MIECTVECSLKLVIRLKQMKDKIYDNNNFAILNIEDGKKLQESRYPVHFLGHHPILYKKCQNLLRIITY